MWPALCADTSTRHLWGELVTDADEAEAISFARSASRATDRVRTSGRERVL